MLVLVSAERSCPRSGTRGNFGMPEIVKAVERVIQKLSRFALGKLFDVVKNCSKKVWFIRAGGPEEIRH